MAHTIATVITVLLTIFRARGFKSQSFQAIAHLFVGGLVATWWTGGDLIYLGLSILLSIAEVICFFYFRARQLKITVKAYEPGKYEAIFVGITNGVEDHISARAETSTKAVALVMDSIASPDNMWYGRYSTDISDYEIVIS